MNAILEQIDKKNIPAHVAIIMDGNGRWAKQQEKARSFGHQCGVEAVRSTIEGAAEIGISFLTLYTFSTENWNRPKEEIDTLMSLLVSAIHNELDNLMKNNIKLNSIGDLNALPENCHRELLSAIKTTQNNTGLTVSLAISYSGKWDITHAAKKIASDCQNGVITVEEINESLVQNYLSTCGIPNPDMLIRTGGEQRISNFLLWQIAYSELFFIDKFWPDFRKNDLWNLIYNFQHIERRYGKTSEQILSH